MKKLFISQPMSGKTEEEIMAVRERAIASAFRHFEEKPEVIDSYFKEAPVDANPLWYLAKSLELLSTADVVYFAEGWEDARGCRIENTCAIEYGIDVIEDYNDSKPRRCDEKTCAPNWENMYHDAMKKLDEKCNEVDSLHRICEKLGSQVNRLTGYRDAVERIFGATQK